MEQAHTRTLENPIALLSRALLLYWKKIGTLISLAFIVFIVGLLQIFSIQFDSPGLSLISSLAGILVSYVSYLAMIRVISSPVSMHIGQAYMSIEQYILPAAWVSILIIFVVLGGTVLLIVPAIIAIVYLSFAMFAVIVDHFQNRDALTYSWHLVRGRWWEVLMRFIVANLVILFIIVIVMSIFWLFGFGEAPAQAIERIRHGSQIAPISQMILEQGIGDFFMVPIALCFIYIFYEALKRTVAKTLERGEKTEINWYIRTLALIGVAFLVVSIFVSSFIVAKVIPELVRATHMPAAVYSIF